MFSTLSVSTAVSPERVWGTRGRIRWKDRSGPDDAGLCCLQPIELTGTFLSRE